MRSKQTADRPQDREQPAMIEGLTRQVRAGGGWRCDLQTLAEMCVNSVATTAIWQVAVGNERAIEHVG